jgi:ribosomal protein S18 acetylase RimI-like enzyme
MQDLVSRSWLAERPLVNYTAGDLDWWITSDSTADYSKLIRLWFDGNELVAWGFIEPPDALDWHVRTDFRGGPVHEEILDWLEAEAGRVAATTTPEDRPNEVEATAVWSMESDAPTLQLIERRGYGPTERTLTHWIKDEPASLAAPDVPAGYRLRTIRWPEEIPARVDVHRAAFNPSRMTIDKYRSLDERRLYSPDLDWIVEAPDGSFAAFTISWWDPIARVGELEPVGTHPDHQRRGLGRAVCLAAMGRLFELGAEEVLVFSETSEAPSEALYASLGCRALTRHRRFERPLARPTIGA